MSKHQSDRKEDIQSAGQTDRVTERQNDSMADSRAAKEPALVFADFRPNLRGGNSYHSSFDDPLGKGAAPMFTGEYIAKKSNLWPPS